MIYPQIYPASTREDLSAPEGGWVDCFAIIKATRDFPRMVQRWREQVDGACTGLALHSTRNGFSHTLHELSQVTMTLGNPCLSVCGRTFAARYSWVWPRFGTITEGPSISLAPCATASIKVCRIVTMLLPFGRELGVDGWMCMRAKRYKPSPPRMSTEIGRKMFHPIIHPWMHPSGTKNEGRKGAFESAPFPPKVVQVPRRLASTRKSTRQGSIK